MTTPTTTYHTIREQWITVIQALTPTRLTGTPFRVYRGGKGEFREWALSSGPRPRKFFIKSTGDLEPPPATDGDIEAMVPAGAVLEVAYPHTWAAYSQTDVRLDYHDLEAIAIADGNQIRDAIGVSGGANYVSGQSRCDADVQRDLEDDEGVSFLVINLTYVYNRSVG